MPATGRVTPRKKGSWRKWNHFLPPSFSFFLSSFSFFLFFFFFEMTAWYSVVKRQRVKVKKRLESEPIHSVTPLFPSNFSRIFWKLQIRVLCFQWGSPCIRSLRRLPAVRPNGGNSQDPSLAHRGPSRMKPLGFTEVLRYCHIRCKNKHTSKMSYTIFTQLCVSDSVLNNLLIFFFI